MFKTRPVKIEKLNVEREYREPYLMDHVVKTGESDTEFYIETDIKFKEPVDAFKRIRAFESDVGIEAVMRLARKEGQTFDNLVASGRFASKQKGVVDSTSIPKTFEERENVAKQLDARTSLLWKSLPKELKQGMSMAEFVKNYDASWLDRIPVPESKKEGDK